MNKLLLVDGSNLLFQMFYGMPSRILNHKGKPIWGILGFIGALLKMINHIQPTHILVLFDGEHENTRTELYPEYKANRIDYSAIPEEETPFFQLNDIYRALSYLNIKFKEITDNETDDYIASYVAKYEKQITIVIASWDSDYFSLISKNVSILRYRGKKSYLCDIPYLQNKLGIVPKQYSFYKALVGDASDHIKGIHKIGPISAARIVNSYSSVEELYLNLENDPQKQLLQNQKEKLLLNQKLIEFQNTLLVPYELDELYYKNKEIRTIEVLKAISVLA